MSTAPQPTAPPSVPPAAAISTRPDAQDRFDELEKAGKVYRVGVAFRSPVYQIADRAQAVATARRAKDLGWYCFDPQGEIVALDAEP